MERATRMKEMRRAPRRGIGRPRKTSCFGIVCACVCMNS
jgi:hypothetical protein